MAEKGYLEGHHMAEMFNMMRENDLIWSFVVNNYLLGREPMPFDLLYWNSDSTRLPASMLTFVFEARSTSANKLMKPGGLELDGDADRPRQDRDALLFPLRPRKTISPPGSRAIRRSMRSSGPVRFVLGASGHIAGVINPPAANKYCYWLNRKTPDDPQEWLAGAERHEGSWWSDWHKWLARKGGPKVEARDPAAGNLAVIEDAPGSYVKERVND